jgi:ribosome-binding factor A
VSCKARKYLARQKGNGDSMRKNSIKNTRINTEVQKVLSNLISREIKDPRINPMTSVIAAEVSPDLKTAKIYISVLGDQESKDSTLRGLKSAASFMRGQLARTLNLRNTPELTFVIDNSIEYGVHMSKLIDEVNKNSSHASEEELLDDDSEDDEEEQDEEDDENYVDETTKDGNGELKEEDE